MLDQQKITSWLFADTFSTLNVSYYQKISNAFLKFIKILKCVNLVDRLYY